MPGSWALPLCASTGRDGGARRPYLRHQSDSARREKPARADTLAIGSSVATVASNSDVRQCRLLGPWYSKWRTLLGGEPPSLAPRGDSFGEHWAAVLTEMGGA